MLYSSRTRPELLHSRPESKIKSCRQTALSFFCWVEGGCRFNILISEKHSLPSLLAQLCYLTNFKQTSCADPSEEKLFHLLLRRRSPTLPTKVLKYLHARNHEYSCKNTKLCLTFFAADLEDSTASGSLVSPIQASLAPPNAWTI